MRGPRPFPALHAAQGSSLVPQQSRRQRKEAKIESSLAGHRLKRKEADGYFVAWCGLGRNIVSFCFPLSLAPGLTEAFLGVSVPQSAGLTSTLPFCGAQSLLPHLKSVLGWWSPPCTRA